MKSFVEIRVLFDYVECLTQFSVVAFFRFSFGGGGREEGI